MLSVIASKVAVFAILRFVLPLFPVSFVNYSTWFISLGLFSTISLAFYFFVRIGLLRVSVSNVHNEP